MPPAQAPHAQSRTDYRNMVRSPVIGFLRLACGKTPLVVVDDYRIPMHRIWIAGAKLQILRFHS